jgi:hypothetical protein
MLWWVVKRLNTDLNKLMRKVLIMWVVVLTATYSFAQKKEGFSIKDEPSKKQMDILYNGKLLTAYCYYDSVMKPVLFPINTLSGITLTRGYPLAPRSGERVDHPHHIGLWLNYEYVNGLDFWNNSTSIPYAKRSHYGTIYHQKMVKSSASKKDATLDITAEWKDHTNKTLLNETTKYNFTVVEGSFIIDRTTTLQATNEDVSLKDVKDGFLGLRVTKELELPSDESVKYVDDKGNVTEVPAVNNDNVSGDYLSSEGLKGDAVWGTRGVWASLFGKKDGKDVSVTIIDHPSNIGYPTYWHSRGYGLFAANPIGQAAFSKGKETLDLIIKKGESVTFRFRVVVHEGTNLTPEQITQLAQEFAKKK